MSEGSPCGLIARLEPGSERLAFTEGPRRLTWSALDRRSRAVAARLLALDLAPGDRVATFLDAGLDAVVLTTALLRAGLVQVPINTRYREAEIAHVLSDSGAALLVAAPGSVAEATAGALADSGPRVISTSAALEDEAFPPSGRADSASAPSAAAPALIVYTSGTTGRSKGVVLSHGALAANVGAVTGLWRFSEADVLVLALPLFHVHGLGLGVLGTLLSGNACVLVPRFSPAAVAQVIEEHGGTVFMGVPTMYHQLLTWLDEDPARAAPLRRARLFTAGSAALPVRDLARFEAHTGHRILERYGMTETGFTLSNPYDGERRAGAVGRPVPGYEARVVGDDGGAVPPGEPGALEVRGDGLMSGYWRDEAATAAAFTADGWFRTGDVVASDPDGVLRIVGRSSVDIIKSGGFKLSAREIEDALREHPAVADAAVVGIADEVWGERVVAAVVARGGAGAVDEAALCDALPAHVASRLADYKKPRAVRLVEELPRNALGKVQKHLLRALFTG